MSAVIKLSSPATREFWEIPVLYEDEHLLALDKPSGLLTSPDRANPDRPSLTKLLHAGIARGAPWAAEGQRTYLMPAHRPDCETSGVMLLAKSKPVLVTLVNLFSAEKLAHKHAALVQDAPAEDRFTVEAKLAPHPMRLGFMCVDPRRGKRSLTVFEVRERFAGFTLLQCEPLTHRPHQIRVHLRHAGLPAVGDRGLWRPAAAALALEAGLSAQTEPDRAAPHCPGRPPRRSPHAAPSRHRRTLDHHRALAEGPDRGGEIPAPVRRQVEKRTSRVSIPGKLHCPLCFRVLVLLTLGCRKDLPLALFLTAPSPLIACARSAFQPAQPASGYLDAQLMP